jgi:NAD+ diphosphatase
MEASALPLEPFFSGPGLDRADHLRANEEELRRLAESPTALELMWRDGLPALGSESRLELCTAECTDLFLGLQDGAPVFCSFQDEFADAWKAFSLLAVLDPRDAPVLAAALSLARWHARHRFCANCGHLSEIVRGGWSRRCPACGAEHFPRVDPVVIMIAEHDGCLLLGRQPHYPPGRYSALAGFVEVGENLEASVARELKEEAGIDVTQVTYVASQPWPFPSSLMVGCHATARSSELTIDRNELEDAHWFTREEIREGLSGAPSAPFQPPPPAAIARTLLEHWLQLEEAKTAP